MTARRRVKRLAWALGGAAVMTVGAGCKVDQAKEVAAYRNVVDISSPAATQPAPTTQPDAARPVTLAEAMLLANQHNERLSIEGENYLQALINKKRAVAGFLPTVALGPSYTLSEGNGSANGGSGGRGSNVGGFATGSTDVPVTGSINLFNGFSDVARLQSTEFTIDQRRALLLDLQESILLDVARTYYQTLKAERSVDVLTNSLAVQEARVRDMQGRAAAGVARPLDVSQTEAQASATRVSLIAARNDVRNGRTVLTLLTGAELAHSVLIDRYPDPVTAPTTPDELLKQATARRQDLIAADAAAQAARRNVDVAFGQYYPSVSLDTNVFLYRDPGSASDWNAILRARLPIFSAGLIEADVRTAWSLFRQAILFRSFLVRQIRQDVDLAFQNLTASDLRIAELRTQLAAAEAAFRAADQSYNIGNATNLERVVAQDALLTAQLQLTAERFDNKVFYLDLLRATGDLREQLEAHPATPSTTQPIVSHPVSHDRDVATLGGGGG
jgi:outer membrane protein